MSSSAYKPATPHSPTRQLPPRHRRYWPSLATAVGVALIALLMFAQPTTALTRLGQQGETDRVTDPNMNVVKAAILGVIEGATEFVPVSSTGHLMVAERAMNIGQTDDTKTAADSYAVVIQIGAIAAVALVYRRRIGSILAGAVGRSREGRHLLIALIVATLPAIVLGVLLHDLIKEHLFGSPPVVIAWIVGGVAILAFQRFRPSAMSDEGATTTEITYRGALIVGLIQCLAMWPGTSRSLVTLLAGLAIGLGLASAVEFAFLLGLVTLGAATVYELAQQGSVVLDAYGVWAPVTGVVVAFISGWAAVKWMLSYLENHDLAVFGWYRIGAGVLVGGLLIGGVL